jgi:hypothetical protein
MTIADMLRNDRCRSALCGIDAVRREPVRAHAAQILAGTPPATGRIVLLLTVTNVAIIDTYGRERSCAPSRQSTLSF